MRSRIRWATAATGSTYTDLPITDLSLPIPASVRRPYSTTEGQPLSDPDLFLHNLEIPGLHLEVEDSLREAVRCFRHELYLACLTMLGRASEGAWIELGLRLATAVERVSTTEARKIRNDLESPYVGVGKKVMQTLRVYERKDLEDIQKAARIRPEELRNAVIWADQVRDSRNSIHYGAKPATPNSYEKVAVLLIGAVPHLRLLYSIYGAVNTVASKKE